MAVIGAWVGLLIDPKTRSTGSAVENPERHSSEMPFSFGCGPRTSREWLRPGNATCESGEWQNAFISCAGTIRSPLFPASWS